MSQTAAFLVTLDTREVIRKHIFPTLPQTVKTLFNDWDLAARFGPYDLIFVNEWLGEEQVKEHFDFACSVALPGAQIILAGLPQRPANLPRPDTILDSRNKFLIWRTPHV